MDEEEEPSLPRSNYSRPITFVPSSTLSTVKEEKKKSNGDDIAAFYKSIVMPNQSGKPTEEDSNKTWCASCRLFVSDHDTHVRGTAHMVTAGYVEPPKSAIMLNATNVGFRMLSAQGWDYDQGLGRDGQGRRQPIATTLKQDRLCLGHKKTERKAVTHRHADIERQAILRRERQQQTTESGKAAARRDRSESQQRSAMLHYLKE